MNQKQINLFEVMDRASVQLDHFNNVLGKAAEACDKVLK